MNDVATNNLAGRMGKEIRAKPGKNKEAAEQRASAVYVLNNELKAILNLNRPPARLNTAQIVVVIIVRRFRWLRWRSRQSNDNRVLTQRQPYVQQRVVQPVNSINVLQRLQHPAQRLRRDGYTDRFI